MIAGDRIAPPLAPERCTGEGGLYRPGKSGLGQVSALRPAASSLVPGPKAPARPTLTTTASWACSPTRNALCDITDLYLAKFSLLPAGKRIFIHTVQQINGWRDLPKTVSARILAQ